MAASFARVGHLWVHQIHPRYAAFFTISSTGFGYSSARRDMLDYPRHAKAGWDIGSGPTESMCKALTQRVKGRS
jgi:hypothetical protein